jgi:hypothetical protein
MSSHIKALGILHIALAVVSILGGALGLLFFGGLAALAGVAAGGADFGIGAAVLGFIGSAIFFVAFVLALPGLVVGIGLLNYRPWARIGGILLSALELLNVPFGTALGLYGLWVLLKPESEALFGERPAARAY